MDFLIHYLADVRSKEYGKSRSPMAKINGYKGYIPNEKRDGVSLIVADDSQHTYLRTQGYTRVGDYKGSGAENGRRGYYFSTVSGRQNFSQGAMQTVQTAVNGVDPRTGRTVTGTTAGVITGKYLPVIQARLKQRSRFAGEALIPVYDDLGNLTAYERSMAPERLSALARNDHLGEMLGAWAGRQAEEEMAQGFTSPEDEPGKDRSGTSPKQETRPEPADLEQREAICDTSYAPERAELRKAWSRLQRRK